MTTKLVIETLLIIVKSIAETEKLDGREIK